MVFEAEGGARFFHSWFDSQLGVPCAFFRSAQEGVWRCVPADQQPVDACAPVAFERPVTPLKSDCTTVTTAGPGDLVTAERRLVPFGDGSLSIARLFAADGAEESIELVDATTTETCDLTSIDRCYPGPVGGILHNVFGDADCNPFDALPNRGGDPCEPLPRYGAVRKGGGCGGGRWQTLELRPVGARVSPVFQVCTTPFDDSEQQLYALGPPVALTTFPLLPKEALHGTGRIRARALTDDAGRPVLKPSALVDTAAAEMTCDGLPFADGLRCVWTNSVYTYTYADPDCLNPIVQWGTLSCPDWPPHAGTWGAGELALALPEPQACPLVYQAFTNDLTASAETRFETTTDGTCIPAPDLPDAANQAATVPADPAVWAALALHTE